MVGDGVPVGVGAAVTVVIPTYNRRDMLDRCLRSVLAQSGFGPESKRLAVLVHDNASTDSTADTMATIDDPRVHYRRNPHNLGFFRNWSMGLAAVGSPYVAFLQDDDQWHPEFLSETVTALDQNPAASASFTDVEVIDADESVVGTRDSGLPTGVFAGARYLEHALRGDNTVVDGSAMVMRTAVLRSVGGFDAGHMIHDIIFNFQFRLAVDHDLVRVGRPLARIRAHDGQIHRGTDRAGAAVGMVAERMEAAALLLTTDRAADDDYRRWLGEQLLRLGRLRSQYTADLAPTINLSAEERMQLAVDDLLSVTEESTVIAAIGGDLLYHSSTRYPDPLSGEEGPGHPTLAGDRRLRPVPSSDGYYSGHPADSQSLIDDLEQARREGATVAAVAWPSFWWLDFHHAFRRHLDRYPSLVDNSRIVIHRLDDLGRPDHDVESSHRRQPGWDRRNGAGPRG